MGSIGAQYDARRGTKSRKSLHSLTEMGLLVSPRRCEIDFERVPASMILPTLRSVSRIETNGKVCSKSFRHCLSFSPLRAQASMEKFDCLLCAGDTFSLVVQVAVQLTEIAIYISLLYNSGQNIGDS